MKLIESQRGAAVETSGEADRRARVERRGHVQALTQGVMPQTLETLDAVSGAFGIQPRYPFWDKDLIELCVSLPSIAKLDRGWTRVVMRDAMAGILPPEIQWRRRKSNLGPNFHRGLLELDRERLDALFESRRTRLADFVNVPAVRRLYETLRADYDRAGPHGVDHAAASRLFRAASVGVWLEDTAP
jgi:asparagine synthase (glutamine-hydrolysing)